MLGRAETAGCGALVVARRASLERRPRLCCLCLEASVWLFLASVWEVMAAGESEEDTNQYVMEDLCRTVLVLEVNPTSLNPYK